MEELFKELFIRNYYNNKIDFIPRNFLINPLYPEYDIDVDGELIENGSEYTNYVQCSYEYTYDNCNVFDIYRNTEECLLLEDLSKIIDETLSQLNEREQAIIRMRYGLYDERSDLTLEEIAKAVGVTRERVRQTEASAMKKLKHPKVSKRLKNYLNDEDGFFIYRYSDIDLSYQYKRFDFIADYIINEFITKNNQYLIDKDYSYNKMQKNNLILISSSKIKSFKETFTKMILEETNNKDTLEINSNLHYNIIYKSLRKHGIFHTYFIPEDMKINITLEISLVNVMISIKDENYILYSNGYIEKI